MASCFKNSVDPDLLASSGSALFARIKKSSGTDNTAFYRNFDLCDPLKYKMYCISNMYVIIHQNEMV